MFRQPNLITALSLASPSTSTQHLLVKRTYIPYIHTLLDSSRLAIILDYGLLSDRLLQKTQIILGAMPTRKKPSHRDPPATAAGGGADASAAVVAEMRPTARSAKDAPPVQEWEYMYPVALLSLAAAASPISQMTLAPVYGSIPSAQNHATMCSVSLLFGFTVRAIGGSWQRLRVLESLTVWAFSLPLLQNLLSPFSGSLGPVAGPLVKGFLSCHAILLPTGFVIADFIARYKQTTSLAARVGSTAAYTMIGVILAFAMYPVLEEKWTGIVQWLPELFKEKFEINPVHLQLALGASYSLLAPSWSVSVFFSEHSHMCIQGTCRLSWHAGQSAIWNSC